MNTVNTSYELREDHIAIFDGFFDEKLLDDYIRYFDFYSNFRYYDVEGTPPEDAKVENKKYVYDRANDRIKDTNIDTITSTFWTQDYMDVSMVSHDVVNTFFDKIYPIYTEKYFVLGASSRHSIFEIKVQKTKPTEGYHVWHHEKDAFRTRNRLMAFILYLNDVDEGGETEFLFQKFRMKPKRNRLVLWPAGYTHTHRGNPPLSGEKYIATGWVEFGSMDL